MQTVAFLLLALSALFTSAMAGAVYPRVSGSACASYNCPEDTACGLFQSGTTAPTGESSCKYEYGTCSFYNNNGMAVTTGNSICCPGTFAGICVPARRGMKRVHLSGVKMGRWNSGNIEDAEQPW